MNITIPTVRRAVPALALLAAAMLAPPYLVGCGRADTPAAAVPEAVVPGVTIIRVADGKLQGQAPHAELGRVMMGQVREDAFTLTNTTATPLNLAGNASCGCTSVLFEKPDAAPGETVHFVVRYNSSAKPENLGLIRQPFLLTLTPAEGDRAEPTLISGFAECHVEASLKLSADAVRYERDAEDPEATVDESVAEVVVTNASATPMHVEVGEVLDNNQSPTDGERGFAAEPTSFEIGPGGRQAVVIRPADSATAGPLHRFVRLSAQPTSGGTGDAEAMQFFVRATVVPRREFVAVPGSFQVSASALGGKTADLGEMAVSRWRSTRPGIVVGVESSTPALTAEVIGDGRCSVAFDPAAFDGGMAEETVTLLVENDSGVATRLRVPVLILP